MKIDTIKGIGSGQSVNIEIYYGRQLKAYNTMLPVGCREINLMRSLFTTEVASLQPFNVQELFQEGGVVYGINQMSKNLIMGDRKELMNGNGFIFGKSGSGKSFGAKSEIGQVLAKTNDDVIIIDPMNEYFEICKKLKGQVVNLSTKTQDYMNPLEVPYRLDATNIESTITEKAEFLYGICDRVLEPEPFMPGHRNAVDNSLRCLYDRMMASEEQHSPTIKDLRIEIGKRDDEWSHGLYVALESFAEGTLNIFAHESNVNIQNRFVTFGIADLGEKLKALGLLIMLENVRNRIKRNQKMNVATRVYIDEVHVITDDDYGNEALEKMWKEVRKQAGLMTGMTQNIQDCLINKRTKAMISNSEFIMLFEQASLDQTDLAEIMEISREELAYVKKAAPGTGVVKFGRSMIPFENKMKKDTLLYALYNTDTSQEEGKESADIAV